MKTIIIALLFLGCSVTNQDAYNENFQELTGYIQSERANPFIFKTADTLIFVYNYNNYEFMNVREQRSIIVEHREGNYYFISELSK